MSIAEDLHWFKNMFQEAISAALAGSPFSVDLLTAIAAQETGQVWGPLLDTLPVNELLQICVGDTLDADKGRKAFPKTKADLIAVPNGGQMFTIAHQALVAMAAHVPAFAAVCLLKRPFLLSPLMLRPAADTLLGDDLRAVLASVDPSRYGAVARCVAP